MRKTILIILLSFIACQSNQKFGTVKWKNGCVDGSCNNREPMVTDLIQNHLKIGISKSEVLNILGEPDNIDEKKNIYSYEYFIKYRGIDPCEIKYLNIEFKDSKVIKFKTEHIEN